MITINKEFYSSPYYFLLRDKGDKYSLYFSVEENLNEARKKDEVIHFKKSKGEMVKNHLKKVAKDKKVKTTKSLKKDLEELVNLDGTLSNSKIPIVDPKLHPKKTMDQTVSAASITNDPISRGYRTYFRESVKEIEDIEDSDMPRIAKPFGWEETEDMDGKETFKFLVKKMGMTPDEAKKRTKQKGQDPTGKKDENSPYYNDKNFITRATLSEIQKQKMIKVVEDILMGKKKYDNLEIGKKELDIPNILKKNILSLKKQAEKQGVSLSELLKMFKNE
jgi:hypothetical protein